MMTTAIFMLSKRSGLRTTVVSFSLLKVGYYHTFAFHLPICHCQVEDIIKVAKCSLVEVHGGRWTFLIHPNVKLICMTK